MDQNSTLMSDAQISEDQLDEIIQYITGAQITKPETLERVRADIVNKINTVMSFNMIGALARVSRLQSIITSLEAKLFDPEEIKHIDDKKEMQEIYDKAMRVMNESQDFIRKYLLQNKDMLRDDQNQVDQLTQAIRALTPEKRDRLIMIMEKGEF